MNKLQKAGGVAAIGLGVLFICYMMLLFLILPAQGFGPGTLNDPAHGISFLATSVLPMLIDFIYIGMAVAFVLIALALYDRLHAVAPAAMQISTTAGLIASVLFLGYAMLNFVSSPIVVGVYAHDAVTGGTSIWHYASWQMD